MKKNIILVLLFFSTIVQAQTQTQTQIESIQFIGITADSLVFIVHSSISGGVTPEYYVESEEEEDNIKVNILYSEAIPSAECYCPVQTTIKIKKNIYLKAIVSIKIRYAIGGTEENPVYSNEYQLIDSKEIDLSNITSIDNFSILSKIAIFPNPVQNIFHVNLGENKMANLEIHDTQGNLLFSKNIISEKGIDVSFLSSGLYFVFIDRKYVSHIIKK